MENENLNIYEPPEIITYSQSEIMELLGFAHACTSPDPFPSK